MLCTHKAVTLKNKSFMHWCEDKAREMAGNCESQGNKVANLIKLFIGGPYKSLIVHFYWELKEQKYGFLIEKKRISFGKKGGY